MSCVLIIGYSWVEFAILKSVWEEKQNGKLVAEDASSIFLNVMQ